MLHTAAASTRSARNSQECPASDAEPRNLQERHRSHFALFSAATDDPARARDLLWSFLPQEILAILADALPESLDGRIPDDKFRPDRTARLWRVAVKPGQPRRYLYFLTEFVSTVVEDIAFTSYLTASRIGDQEASNDTTSGEYVPSVVLGLVLYRGKDSWTAPRSLSALRKAPPSFEPYLSQFEYIFGDLARMCPKERAGRGDLQAVLQALVCADRETMSADEVADTVLRPMPESSELAPRLLHYALRELPCDTASLRDAVRIAWPNHGANTLRLVDIWNEFAHGP